MCSSAAAVPSSLQSKYAYGQLPSDISEPMRAACAGDCSDSFPLRRCILVIPATSVRPESKLAMACALLSLSMTARHEPSDSITAEHHTLTQARLGTAERHEMQVENSNESLNKKIVILIPYSEQVNGCYCDGQGVFLYLIKTRRALP